MARSPNRVLTPSKSQSNARISSFVSHVGSTISAKSHAGLGKEHTHQYVKFAKWPTQSGVAFSRKGCFPHGLYPLPKSSFWRHDAVTKTTSDQTIMHACISHVVVFVLFCKPILEMLLQRKHPTRKSSSCMHLACCMPILTMLLQRKHQIRRSCMHATRMVLTHSLRCSFSPNEALELRRLLNVTKKNEL